MGSLNDPAIALRNVVKRYDAVEAVKGITFDIHRGDFFGFLGPNGAGKTTTISMITGLAEITSGTIEVFGKDVRKDYRMTRSSIGLGAQEPTFDPFFPIRRVLEFQGGYFGLPRSAARRRSEELLRRFGLWEHRHKTTRQISGGMKRRLLIAKALVHDPEIVILDEPTAGVDVELRRELWEDLRTMNREGKTIVLTTHYIEEAEALCQRIGIIHEGRMKAVEDKDVLMAKLSERKVTVQLRGMSEPLRLQLSAMHGVTVDDARVSFAAEDVDAQLHALLPVVREHGGKIADIHVEALRLEDIFLQLTETQ